MPHKGNAFNKPTVNASHKSEVRKMMQHTEKAGAGRSGLAKELADIIEASAMNSERQGRACRAVDEAVTKLERDDPPLGGL